MLKALWVQAGGKPCLRNEKSKIMGKGKAKASGKGKGKTNKKATGL